MLNAIYSQHMHAHTHSLPACTQHRLLLCHTQNLHSLSLLHWRFFLTIYFCLSCILLGLEVFFSEFLTKMLKRDKIQKVYAKMQQKLHPSSQPVCMQGLYMQCNAHGRPPFPAPLSLYFCVQVLNTTKCICVSPKKAGCILLGIASSSSSCGQVHTNRLSCSLKELVTLSLTLCWGPKNPLVWIVCLQKLALILSLARTTTLPLTPTTTRHRWRWLFTMCQSTWKKGHYLALMRMPSCCHRWCMCVRALYMLWWFYCTF